MRHDKREMISRAETSADVWEDQTAEKAALAMAAWMKRSVHLSRPLSSLTKVEMKNLALAAINCWIVAASHRVAETPDPNERTKLHNLLMG
jgi:hypothetical protein